MITIGIDPGTARLGFGVIAADHDPRSLAFGVLETTADMAMPHRLADLYEGVSALLTAHQPGALAVETLFFSRNATTAIAVGQARGVVLLAAAHAEVAVFEYSPSEVKQAVVGYGKADKHQMQEMVRLILGLPHTPEPDDAADALAVALCHVQTAPFRATVGRQR